MDIQATIKAAKARAGDPAMSDSALASILGIAQATFARDKRQGFSDAVALRLAELAGTDPAAVLATVRAMRERDPSVKRVLETIARRVAGTAAAALMGLSLQLSPEPAFAGGDDGIRTHDALLAHTPLAGEHLRPLGHVSGGVGAPASPGADVPGKSIMLTGLAGTAPIGVVPGPASIGRHPFAGTADRSCDQRPFAAHSAASCRLSNRPG